MAGDEVVVTGLGMVTPLGATAAACGEAWRSGRAAPRQRMPALAAAGRPGAEAALPPPFDAAARLGSRRMIKYMSGAALLGCVAAREAAQDADLRRRFSPDRVGLYAGAGLAAAGLDEAGPMIRASRDEAERFSCRLLGERGLPAANPVLSFKILPNMPGCLVSIQEEIRGPSLLFTPWEGQTGAALLEARKAVASGEVDAALCGGADDPAHPMAFLHLVLSGHLPNDQIPASGAAYLVFERAESARRDGRRIHARVAVMELIPAEGRARDPLAERMGRSYAAAPAILLALACQGSAAGESRIAILGEDRQEFQAAIGNAT